LQDGKDYLSPRFTISLYAIFSLGLFFIRSLSVHIFCAAAVSLLLLIYVSWKKMKGGLFPIMLFLLFTFGGNLFFHSGKVLYSNGLLSITDEGLYFACIRTLRVFSLIMSAKILTAVLSVEEMIHSMGIMLKPLEKIGIPIREFFSLMGLTLQSFPLLMEYLSREYREEMKKNEVRGFRKRMRHTASFLMPVFVKSIRSPESFFVRKVDGTGN
jgi:energy-coupling factor transport system permease protein